MQQTKLIGASQLTFWLMMMTSLALAGCSPWQMAKRTMFSELNEFPQVTDGRLSVIQYRRWAKKELKAAAFESGHDFSSDFARGFIHGFTNYVYGGGTLEPPPIAPSRYWRVGFRNNYGDKSIQDWYEGCALGSKMAKEKGYRKRATVPTSMLLGYNLEAENSWLDADLDVSDSDQGSADADKDPDTEDNEFSVPLDAPLNSKESDENPENERPSLAIPAEPEPTILEPQVQESSDGNSIDSTNDETQEDEQEMSTDSIEALPNGTTDEPIPIDEIELEIPDELLESGVNESAKTPSKPKPFEYVFGPIPPSPPWTTNEPKTAGPMELARAKTDELKPIRSSGFTPITESTLTLDAIVPAKIEVSIEPKTESAETETPVVTEPEKSDWQSRE